jgi:MinD superfamily P-loop ATPase
MKQLVILSGKGGTGKTTIAAALAELASRDMPVVLADADVDAANLDMLLAPTRQEQHTFTSGQVARIDEEDCAGCGSCEVVCRFDAVHPPANDSELAFRVDPTRCEGCAACFYMCPSEAIHMEPQHAGQWFRSDTRFGPLFHAHLKAGGENSGKLVTLVRQRAKESAESSQASLVLVDGPPGVGCPVISALSGVDGALLVAEPTVSGVHDLQRAIGTAKHFGVSTLVVINKSDINPRVASTIEELCRAQGVDVVGQIPYNSVMTEAMVQGQPVTSYSNGDNGELLAALDSIWDETKKHLFVTV